MSCLLQPMTCGIIKWIFYFEVCSCHFEGKACVGIGVTYKFGLFYNQNGEATYGTYGWHCIHQSKYGHIRPKLRFCLIW